MNQPARGARFNAIYARALSAVKAPWVCPDPVQRGPSVESAVPAVQKTVNCRPGEALVADPAKIAADLSQTIAKCSAEQDAEAKQMSRTQIHSSMKANPQFDESKSPLQQSNAQVVDPAMDNAEFLKQSRLIS